MDDFTKMMLMMGKGMWGGTKLMLNSMGALANRLSGNTPEQRNARKRGVTEYKPSEIGGFFPPSEAPGNTVISGGNDEIRAEAVGAFAQLAAYYQMPVVIIHSGNQILEQYMLKLFQGTGLVGIINQMNPCYEPFYGKNSREICQMIMESAPKEFEMKMNVRTYIEGMCAFLAAKGRKPHYRLLSSCPHGQMFVKVDEAMQNGLMTQEQGQAIKMRLMAGQNEYYKIENYFYDLEMQIGPVLWKHLPAVQGQNMPPVSISGTLANQGILLLDVCSVSNQILLNLMLSEIKLADQKGIRLACVLDSLEVGDNEYLKKMIEQNSKCSLAFSSEDVYAACNADEKLFHILIGKSVKSVIFRHGSNVSATKWSEGIGSYDKEEVSHSYSKGKTSSPIMLFPSVSSTQSMNVSMKREYIVKPEDIIRMGNREAYIYSRSANELAHTELV